MSDRAFLLSPAKDGIRHTVSLAAMLSGRVAGFSCRAEVDDRLFIGHVGVIQSRLGRNGVALPQAGRGVDDDLLLMPDGVQQAIPQAVTRLARRWPLDIVRRRNALAGRHRRHRIS
ncbi:hypothetical protein [Haladaptatus halobius]|uniref:hypothetical protein n=1 Tax=Haladaptatus halobius TaxID=2884875 RepID=UPI001D09F2CE|nr:hypothetical protein [Haladaptatus halobius]